MTAPLYVGLMSGTSLDGVDAALVELGQSAGLFRLIASAHEPFDAPLRDSLASLGVPGEDEIERAALAGIALARRYASAVRTALASAGVAAGRVRAIGCHGQTVRHRPERGYTVQLGNPALLAELTGIRVVADLRSRDLAAGGQGAPLAPAFHAAAFASPGEDRAILNLGGIANLTCLSRSGAVTGFDCGPGNCLMDLWAARHLGEPFDRDGAWAASGRVIGALLERLREEPYFAAPPPKSTGRERFNEAWLRARLDARCEPRDVQATLLELTARAAADAVRAGCPGAARLIVCGGGTRNRTLMQRLALLLEDIPVESSERHGIEPQLVEAVAFAWLAHQALEGTPASLPAVTGARGARVLGAIYPA